MRVRLDKEPSITVKELREHLDHLPPGARMFLALADGGPKKYGRKELKVVPICHVVAVDQPLGGSYLTLFDENRPVNFGSTTHDVGTLCGLYVVIGLTNAEHIYIGRKRLGSKSADLSNICNLFTIPLAGSMAVLFAGKFITEDKYPELVLYTQLASAQLNQPIVGQTPAAVPH